MVSIFDNLNNNEILLSIIQQNQVLSDEVESLKMQLVHNYDLLQDIEKIVIIILGLIIIKILYDFIGFVNKCINAFKAGYNKK